mmetsp:Transcript_82783/g.165211  ORF Transcript_82783/g.165211 Transcript_82783/m.165211 type:complete len:224 (+) Transcript_82783:81-752(+)
MATHAACIGCAATTVPWSGPTYADGCSHSIGAFTLHFPAPFCSTRAELAADMARFCVRHNGAKSTLQYTWVPEVPQTLELRAELAAAQEAAVGQQALLEAARQEAAASVAKAEASAAAAVAAAEERAGESTQEGGAPLAGRARGEIARSRDGARRREDARRRRRGRRRRRRAGGDGRWAGGRGCRRGRRPGLLVGDAPQRSGRAGCTARRAGRAQGAGSEQGR